MTHEAEARRQLGAQRCAAALAKVHRVQDLLAEAHSDLGPVQGVGPECSRLSKLIGDLFYFEPLVARLVQERPLVDASLLAAPCEATPLKQAELCPGYSRGDLVIVQYDRRNTRVCQLHGPAHFSTAVLEARVFLPFADEWRPCYIRPDSILRTADGKRAEAARESLARLKQRQARMVSVQAGAGVSAPAGPLSVEEFREAARLALLILGIDFQSLLDLNATGERPALIVPAETGDFGVLKATRLADLYDRAQAARGDSRRAVRR